MGVECGVGGKSREWIRPMHLNRKWSKKKSKEKKKNGIPIQKSLIG